MSEYISDDKYLVNGPVNVVRLEGKINGIAKKIYLFFSEGVSQKAQNKCSNVNAVNIDKYIIDNMKNRGGILDFFIESHHFKELIYSKKPNSKTMLTSTYINNILDLVTRLIYYDKNQNLMESPVLPNVRFHGIDFVIHFKIYIDLIDTVDNLLREYNIEYTPSTVNNMIDVMNKYKKKIQYYHDKLLALDKNGKLIEAKSIPENNIKIFQPIKFNIVDEKSYDSYSIMNFLHIINKTYFVCKNMVVKNFLRKMFDEYKAGLMLLIKKIDSFIDFLIYVSDIEQKLDFNQQMDINQKLDSLFLDFVDEVATINRKFTVAYTLRRFLDKDYVTDAVFYIDRKISVNIIWYLVHDFDFKITHYAYSTVSSIKFLNDEIKMSSDANTIFSLLCPETANQCVDLTNFPKKFE